MELYLNIYKKVQDSYIPINPDATDTTDQTGSDSTSSDVVNNGQPAANPNANAVSGGGSGTGGVGSSTSTSGGGKSQSTPTSSGSFTNLNQYVNANADQSAGLGSKIQQDVQGSANTGLSQLNNSSNEFNTQNAAETANPNDFTTQDVYNTAENVLNAPASTNSTTPSSSTSTGTGSTTAAPLVAQSDIDAYNQVRAENAAFTAGSDTAPKALTDLADYQTAANSLNTAEQNAQLTGTESGRNTLLQQVNNNPNYTAGETNLDELLTQNIPSNTAIFANLQNNLLGQYGLANQQQTAETNATNTRATDIANTATAAGNINTVLNGPVDPNNPQSGVLTNYVNTLQATPGTLNATQTQNIATSTASLIAQLQQQFGTSTPYGIPIATLAAEIANPNSSVGAATIQNSLSPDTLAKLNALNSLAGIAPNTLGTTTLGPQDPNQFNAGVTNTYTKADQQLQQEQTAFETDAKSQSGQSLNEVANPTMINLVGTYLNQGDQLSGIQSATQAYTAGIQTLGTEISKLNIQRQQNGLPPLQATPDLLAYGRNQALNQIAYNIYSSQIPGTPYNPAGYDPSVNYYGMTTSAGPIASYINDRINSTNSDGYGAQYSAMINGLATANVFDAILQNVNNNPGYQVGSATINQS